MKTYDLVIIGGGMVGLALAASLRNSPLRLAVIESFPPQTPTEQVTDRVSALNLASRQLLQELGVWSSLLQTRATPYTQMYVWEKDSFADIEFNGQSLGLTELGHIVENHLIRHELWQQVKQQNNADILAVQPKKLNIGEHNAVICLEDEQLLSAKLIVGADGANSWVRRQADIPLVFRDYGHHALVCNVECDDAHQNVARQIFSPDAILAFLPLHQENLCSIVWSLPPEQAQFLQHCDELTFNNALAAAFERRLGSCKVVSSRKTFPLTARYARNFAQPRIALIGDAAHTIHPLAGLGVNLGFQDAAYLAQQIEKILHANSDIGEYRALRDYERRRKTEAIKLLITMQGLKDLFHSDNPIKKWIRGVGLTVTNRLSIVKETFIKQAFKI